MINKKRRVRGEKLCRPLSHRNSMCNAPRIFVDANAVIDHIESNKHHNKDKEKRSEKVPVSAEEGCLLYR